MYIAFKWLIGLTLAMWLSMCTLDIIVKRNFETKQEGLNTKISQIARNTTIPLADEVQLQTNKYYKHVPDKPSRVTVMPCIMFLAGALVVSLYNRKNEIIILIKQKISEVNTRAVIEKVQDYIKVTLYKISDLKITSVKLISLQMSNKILSLWNRFSVLVTRKDPRVNLLLLKKLQEVGEERKNLGQLLIAAIHENKNIRMQYELEMLAKNKLARHIENTQKVLKENRSKYVSFQQLYLVTHQENSFLKCRVKKLAKEKEEAEKNLLELVNEVYKSTNSQLKAFCSKFIVRTTDNLLNTDVGAEIQKFLDKSRSTSASSSNWQLSELSSNSSSSWPISVNTRFAEIVQDDVLVPLISDAPKMKGLPGEYVWTVKDKDGLIEKLYEYDYETDLNDGETIKRIRQYSVYYDKDCLLDFMSSGTVINDPRCQSRCVGVDYPITTQGFLTGSEAFQKFLQNSIIITNSTPQLTGPPLQNG
ncbi:unnamed protein product [Spodoptera littoralis]|uniref:Uncharacterized protein n=1 Tax=Spodoptera littoralis TaxID=7109 RepID=A0A9P0IEE8_SPOLI|nr:unnamed protein product [Spodoptera littoralis]CAH1646333.1 unnamed protein product [Spodoptera littoralis]